jgi:hypothetical protein
VPDTLCSLETWHILWGLDRYFCSRFFSPLKLDDATTLRRIDPGKAVSGSDSGTEAEDSDGGIVPMLKPEDADGGIVPMSKRTKAKNLTRKKPIEKYIERFHLERGSLQLTDEYLLKCSFFRFYSEVEEKTASCIPAKRSHAS